MGDADVENSAGIVEWKRQRILLFFYWKSFSQIF
jgi:hypothetical protein